MWVFKGGVYSSLALFDNVSIHALRQLQSALMLRENAEKEKKKHKENKSKGTHLHKSISKVTGSVHDR